MKTPIAYQQRQAERQLQKHIEPIENVYDKKLIPFSILRSPELTYSISPTREPLFQIEMDSPTEIMRQKLKEMYGSIVKFNNPIEIKRAKRELREKNAQVRRKQVRRLSRVSQSAQQFKRPNVLNRRRSSQSSQFTQSSTTNQEDKEAHERLMTFYDDKCQEINRRSIIDPPLELLSREVKDATISRNQQFSIDKKTDKQCQDNVTKDSMKGRKMVVYDSKNKLKISQTGEIQRIMQVRDQPVEDLVDQEYIKDFKIELQQVDLFNNQMLSSPLKKVLQKNGLDKSEVVQKYFNPLQLRPIPMKVSREGSRPKSRERRGSNRISIKGDQTPSIAALDSKRNDYQTFELKKTMAKIEQAAEKREKKQMSRSKSASRTKPHTGLTSGYASGVISRPPEEQPQKQVKFDSSLSSFANVASQIMNLPRHQSSKVGVHNHEKFIAVQSMLEASNQAIYNQQQHEQRQLSNSVQDDQSETQRIVQKQKFNKAIQQNKQRYKISSLTRATTPARQESFHTSGTGNSSSQSNILINQNLGATQRQQSNNDFAHSQSQGNLIAYKNRDSLKKSHQFSYKISHKPTVKYSEMKRARIVRQMKAGAKANIEQNPSGTFQDSKEIKQISGLIYKCDNHKSLQPKDVDKIDKKKDRIMRKIDQMHGFVSNKLKMSKSEIKKMKGELQQKVFLYGKGGRGRYINSNIMFDPVQMSDKMIKMSESTFARNKDDLQLLYQMATQNFNVLDDVVEDKNLNVLQHPPKQDTIESIMYKNPQSPKRRTMSNVGQF